MRLFGLGAPRHRRFRQPFGDTSSPNLLDALTTGNPAEAIASVYKTIEIHTAITPPIVIDIAGLSSGQPPSAITSFIKPTVILRGSAGGDLTLDPLGDPGDGTLGLVAIFAGLLGAGFLLGRLSKR